MNHEPIDEKEFRRILALGKLDSANQKKLLYYKEMHDAIMEKARSGIKFIKPILRMDGEIPVMYPNSITVIQGPKGVHKSRFAESVIAPYLGREGVEAPLGFTADRSREYLLIVCDTERNAEDQLPFAIQHIKELAGYEGDEIPENMRVISFVTEPRDSRLESLKLIIGNLRMEFPERHFIILVDVITDLVGSFNSVYDSLGLTDFFNELINTFQCSIIGVIHQNPVVNSDKARGHLGTEFVNKASVVLQLVRDKDDNLYFKFRHIRADKLPKEKFHLGYDAGNRRLIREGRQEKTAVRTDQELFEEALLEALPPGTELMQKDLVEKLREKLGKSVTTIKSRIITNEERIIKECTLLFRRDGGIKYYYLSEQGE